MGSHPWTKVVIARKTLDNSWWEELLGELSNLQATVWSEWRWLHDDRATSHDSWSDLSTGKVDWEVPWNDSSANTKWHLADENLALWSILNLLVLELHLSDLSEPEPATHNLPLGSSNWLSLLLSQELSKTLLLSHNSVGEVIQLLGALLWGGVLPGVESLAGIFDGIVKVLLGCDWDGWVLLLGRWVDAVAGGLSLHGLAVDDVLEGGKIKSHDCGLCVYLVYGYDCN